MCSLDIMFQRNPQNELLGKPKGVSHDNVPEVVYAATADADIWHRRPGRMNPRSMELLRGKEGNRMEHTGTASDCGICALSKSRQHAHPKKSTRTPPGRCNSSTRTSWDHSRLPRKEDTGTPASSLTTTHA